MNIEVRPYSSLDETKLRVCVKELREYLSTLNPNRKKDINDDVYKKITNELIRNITSERGAIFVTELDNDIVGYIYGVIVNSSEKDTREFVPLILGKVEDIYVEKHFQNKGVGTLLMNEIQKFFKENGCNKITLTVLSNNQHAIEYYRKLGFETECLEMIKLL